MLSIVMLEKKYTKNILDYATFGIDENINANATVEVKLKDLVFVAQTLQELVQYFHNRVHYPTVEDVHEYMGSRKSGGAFDLLSTANYDAMRSMLPKSMDELYDQGVFDSPELPFYFKPKE